MGKQSQLILIFTAVLALGGCSYGYYLGLHGPSIRTFADIHQGYTEDEECLECHFPESLNEEAPVTSHPGFTGCLECHND